MLRKTVFVGFLFIAQLLLGSDAVPTVHEVYETAQSGDLDKAHRMIETVLQTHPDSAKAHYVDAEILAKEGKLDQARQELGTAQKIDPSLSFAKGEAVHKLEAKLAGSNQALSMPQSAGATHASSFPWIMVLGIAGVGIFLFLIVRALGNRNNIPSYGQPYSASNASMGNSYNPQPSYPSQSSGLGSTIASGLAGGAAAGVGFVAAEELMHHFMDGGQGSAESFSQGDHYTPMQSNFPSSDDYDMGGNDFGLDDSSSWDNGDSSSDSSW